MFPVLNLISKANWFDNLSGSRSVFYLSWGRGLIDCDVSSSICTVEFFSYDFRFLKFSCLRKSLMGMFKQSI